MAHTTAPDDTQVTAAAEALHTAWYYTGMVAYDAYEAAKAIAATVNPVYYATAANALLAFDNPTDYPTGGLDLAAGGTDATNHLDAAIGLYTGPPNPLGVAQVARAIYGTRVAAAYAARLGHDGGSWHTVRAITADVADTIVRYAAHSYGTAPKTRP